MKAPMTSTEKMLKAFKAATYILSYKEEVDTILCKFRTITSDKKYVPVNAPSQSIIRSICIIIPILERMKRNLELEAYDESYENLLDLLDKLEIIKIRFAQIRAEDTLF